MLLRDKPSLGNQDDWLTLFGSPRLPQVIESACQGFDGCDPVVLVKVIRPQDLVKATIDRTVLVAFYENT